MRLRCSLVPLVSLTRATALHIDDLLLVFHERNEQRFELIFVHFVADQFRVQAAFRVTTGHFLLPQLDEMLVLASDRARRGGLGYGRDRELLEVPAAHVFFRLAMEWKVGAGAEYSWRCLAILPESLARLEHRLLLLVTQVGRWVDVC